MCLPFPTLFVQRSSAAVVPSSQELNERYKPKLTAATITHTLLHGQSGLSQKITSKPLVRDSQAISLHFGS